MVAENVVDWHAMVVDNKNRIGGTIDMPIIVPNPPRVGGVKATPEHAREGHVGLLVLRPERLERKSVGRRRPI